MVKLQISRSVLFCDVLTPPLPSSFLMKATSINFVGFSKKKKHMFCVEQPSAFINDLQESSQIKTSLIRPCYAIGYVLLGC